MLDERIEPIPFAGCWIWMGDLNRDGYGRRVDGSRDHRPAHKVFYEREKGPVPDGLCVLHKCDIRSCVNPDHMFIGTKTDNSVDKVTKSRQAQGSSHSNATKRGFLARGGYRRRKITRELSEAIKNDPRPAKEAALAFDVGVHTVRNIRQGKHVFR
jgi:hypothetical protein